MNDYIAKCYARQLSESEVKSRSPKTNYLPHQGVININRPNRVRVVLDAAATYSETSLNQNLKGPDFLSSLIGVFMRFQEGQFEILGYVEAIFHQAKALKEDNGSLRFLWWTIPSLPINKYIMQANIFSSTDSPCCAKWVLKITA